MAVEPRDAIRWSSRDDESPPRNRYLPAMGGRALLRGVVLFLVVGLGLPTLFVAWLPAPFLWIFALWAVACVAAAFSRRGTRSVGWLLPLAAVCFGLFAWEAGLTLTTKEHGPRIAQGGRYTTTDDGIGFRPVAGVAVDVEGIEHGNLLYRATYTIGDDGWRITPPARPPVQGAVICLGGSFTYGDGLADEDTYPWRLTEALDRRYEVHNLSFQGWGAHQMLALIQAGDVEAVVESPLLHAFYVAIPHHVRRAVGLTSWARNAPRYVRRADGTLVRAGMLTDTVAEASLQERMTERVRAALEMSRVARRLLPRRRAGPDDRALYGDIVDAARRELLDRHPSAQFHILVWDDGLEGDAAFLAALEARGHDVHRASAFLPGLGRPPSRWHLGRWDGHPSAEAAAAMAAWAARIVSGP